MQAASRKALDLNRRTIDRYLSIFQRLFIIHWLPNLATTASRQNHARSKVHAVDTSFAVESLTRAGVDILQRRETFGALLESYVVNQVIAATEWATTQAQSYFWRQDGNTNPEVDLVLVDTQKRLIGIEIKASREVGPHLPALGPTRSMTPPLLSNSSRMRPPPRLFPNPATTPPSSSAMCMKTTKKKAVASCGSRKIWPTPMPSSTAIICNSS